MSASPLTGFSSIVDPKVRRLCQLLKLMLSDMTRLMILVSSLHVLGLANFGMCLIKPTCRDGCCIFTQEYECAVFFTLMGVCVLDDPPSACGSTGCVWLIESVVAIGRSFV